MRFLPSRRSSVLGSVNWAFVITLFLLLGFIFLWYSAADERDKAKSERAQAVAGLETLKREATAVGEALREHSLVLGWSSKTFAVGGNTYNASDLEVARRHLALDGKVETEVAGQKVEVAGMYNMLRNSLKVQMSQLARTASSAAATSKDMDFGWATPKFRTKLTEVAALSKAVPPPPSPPVDSGDEAAHAKYRADLAEYTQKFEAYQGGMKELNSAEYQQEWKRFKQIIGLPGVVDPDTVKVVEIDYAPKVDAPPTNFQDLLGLWHAPFQAILDDMKLNKEADLASQAKLTGDLKAERQVTADLQKRYDELKTLTETDLTKLRADLATAESRASTNEQAARKAENALATGTAEAKAERSKLGSELAAYKERVASEKEQADLQIRRDEPDGRLLAVSNERALGTINIGTVGRSYPGLKFVVSFIDRGGFRVAKGEVQVIKVTGSHSSEVRVLSSVATLSSGDLISNPLFSVGRDIHVYCVGWTPDLIQRRRFADMHVVLDERPTADTDWFIVPDEWQGGSAAAPPEGAEEGAAPAVGSSPLDRARQEAQTFGATVVTRRMIDTFLRL